MRALLDELLAAARVFARAPAFTALAVGVLGLGLGAVIFMYGVADTLMMMAPPYPNADRLAVIVTIDGQTPGDYDDNMLPLDYLKVREAATQFEAMGAVYVGTAYLTGDGQAERYDGGFADGRESRHRGCTGPANDQVRTGIRFIHFFDERAHRRCKGQRSVCHLGRGEVRSAGLVNNLKFGSTVR